MHLNSLLYVYLPSPQVLHFERRERGTGLLLFLKLKFSNRSDWNNFVDFRNAFVSTGLYIYLKRVVSSNSKRIILESFKCFGGG